MGQVNVEIGGRSYALSCRDGGEDHLIGLASDIAGKADGLTRSLGAMSESRLLLMAAARSFRQWVDLFFLLDGRLHL